MSLQTYSRKRNFKKTTEPPAKRKNSEQEPIFVVQKHAARKLHYDFRLEADGVLKSWAVPKGPSLNPKDKRLAVEVEDHPLDYATFQGTIPKGEYGAGEVSIWDQGTWHPQGSVRQALKKGHLDFELHGDKLMGSWSLIRMKGTGEKKNNWLLVKSKADIMPDFVEPQLAQLVEHVPMGPEWLHEIKFDGYRSLCRIDKNNEGSKVKILTRSGKDWTSKYGRIAEHLEKLPVTTALLDGELVWVDDKGHSNFHGLQNALSEGDDSRLALYLFDCLYLDGEDLRNLTLKERKKRLAALLKKNRSSKLLYSEHWQSGGEQIFKESCRLHFEGIVSKNADGTYHSGRDSSWQKTKCSLRQEFVIGGHTDSPSAARPIGALLTGTYEEGKLKYTGKVGTGFNHKDMQEFLKKAKPLKASRSPFGKLSPRMSGVHWLKPKLVAELEFKSWTGSGSVRQASFQGWRMDKSSKSIHEERPVDAVKLTHPDRIVYPKNKITKQEVFSYFEKAYPLMAPFLKDRPLSILRCQETIGDQCFYQKHMEGSGDQARAKKVSYKDKSGKAILAEKKEDVLELIQAGAIELHAWGGQFKNITRPDTLIFDLDPSSLKMWKKVVETALEIKDMLEKLNLKSFVKVTGGKGLHIQVPIQPDLEWDEAKNFCKSLMQVLVDRNPDLYTTNMRMNARENKIFLDYLRNGYGATAVLPYSLRAKPGATVAAPISWRSVKNDLKPDQFTIADLPKLLKRVDPWKDYWKIKQKIDLKRLSR